MSTCLPRLTVIISEIGRTKHLNTQNHLKKDYYKIIYKFIDSCEGRGSSCLVFQYLVYPISQKMDRALLYCATQIDNLAPCKGQSYVAIRYVHQLEDDNNTPGPASCNISLETSAHNDSAGTNSSASVIKSQVSVILAATIMTMLVL